MDKNSDKILSAQEAAQIFLNFLGPDDIYKSILIEVFLEEVLSKEKNDNKSNQNMDLSNQERQNGS